MAVDEPFDGTRLKVLMDALGWSQRDMAGPLHVGRRRIREAVAGKERAPPAVEAWWLELEDVVTAQMTAQARKAALDRLRAAAPTDTGWWEKVSA